MALGPLVVEVFFSVDALCLQSPHSRCSSYCLLLCCVVEEVYFSVDALSL